MRENAPPSSPALQPRHYILCLTACTGSAPDEHTLSTALCTGAMQHDERLQPGEAELSVPGPSPIRTAYAEARSPAARLDDPRRTNAQLPQETENSV